MNRQPERMKNRPAIHFILLGITAQLFLAACSPKEGAESGKAQKPNVLMILIDDLPEPKVVNS